MFRVMCVDDNRDIADSEAQLLQICGIDARACYDGPGALLLAATFRPTVCLIDLNMPGMGGDELAKRLRELWVGEPPVLIGVTAMDGEASRRRIEAAFDQHLVKPVGPRRLVALIDGQLEASQAAESEPPTRQ
ncbi:MAG TPA: response regulator [Urbifossiella sp.]|nr:response regulator [Urbifossiella sp.]